MTVIDEGRLRLAFDPATWTAVKWDEHELYLQRIAKLNGQLTGADGSSIPEGTKAVDVVALAADALYLIELKDFRGHTDANAFRQEHELALEIGLKVRDTVAGIVGAYRSCREDPALGRLAAALHDRRLPIRVLAWILEDPIARHRKGRVVRDRTRAHQLQQRLRWLTRDVWVDDPLSPYVTLGGVQVRAH